MRRGLLMKMAGISVTTARYAEQLAHSAATLGRKYHFDEKHSTHVADLSLMLFRALRADHGLGPQAEILLRTAGLLHDIGAFVSNNSHHKHSMYLILNSELFGLTRRDNTMVALIARYHRRSVPRLTHPEYAALDRDSRLVVAKLAAILRVADAMDRSHLQHIRDITCSREERRFVLTVPDVEDVTLERLAVKEKGTLFESIFGLQVILRTAQTQKGSLFDG
jgi:exopolyphosphatase/guanosine-5'-triphosphate,3'-diphosphate pyrophosphatase